MRSLLQKIEPIKHSIGPICLTGWAWDYRPDWAAELGIDGIDTDPAMLQRMGVELRGNISFDQVIAAVNEARFCPVIHRPLFNHLGIVTNRTFETFCSDTIPLLMLPSEMIESIYGPAARLLAVGEDVVEPYRGHYPPPRSVLGRRAENPRISCRTPFVPAAVRGAVGDLGEVDLARNAGRMVCGFCL